MGKRQFDREKKTLIFYDEIQFKVASIMNSFLSDLATNLLLNSDITLFDQQLKTTQVSLMADLSFLIERAAIFLM